MLDTTKKHNTYDSFWLSRDMQNMGYIFEYCNKYCERLYQTSIDREKFLTSFMKSNVRKEAEEGHPRILSQSAVDTIQMFVDVDLKGNINQFRQVKNKSYALNQLYWVGWMYAYIHFQEDIPCSKLVEYINIEKMLEYYYLGHEMDLQTFHSHIKPFLDKVIHQ